MEIGPVSPDRWSHLVALFDRRGPRGGLAMPGHCWCAWWRERTGSRARNRQAMRALVAEGREPGLIAYVDAQRASAS